MSQLSLSCRSDEMTCSRQRHLLAGIPPEHHNVSNLAELHRRDTRVAHLQRQLELAQAEFFSFKRSLSPVDEDAPFPVESIDSAWPAQADSWADTSDNGSIADATGWRDHIKQIKSQARTPPARYQFTAISPQMQCSPQALPDTPRHLVGDSPCTTPVPASLDATWSKKENLTPTFAANYPPSTPPRLPPGLESRRSPPGLEMTALPFTCSSDDVARAMACSPSRTRCDTSSGRLTVWDTESFAAYTPLREDDLSSVDAVVTPWKYRTLSRDSPVLTTLLAHRDAIAQTPKYSPLKKRLELRCRRVFNRRHGRYDAREHKDGPVVLTVPSPRSNARRLDRRRKEAYRSPTTSPLRISRTAPTCSVEFESMEDIQSDAPTPPLSPPTGVPQKRTALGRVLSGLLNKNGKRAGSTRRVSAGIAGVSSWKRVVSQPIRGLGLVNSIRRVTR